MTSELLSLWKQFHRQPLIFPRKMHLLNAFQIHELYHLQKQDEYGNQLVQALRAYHQDFPYLFYPLGNFLLSQPKKPHHQRFQ